MSKTRTPKRTKAAILTPNICSDFPGSKGDTVQWQNVPSMGCTVSTGTTTWPFSPASPIHLPLPAGTTVTIVVNPPTTSTYNFTVSCCANETLKTVTVS